MPEGDTVFRAARLMRRAMAGRVLTATDFRVPRHATADLAGQTVAEVVPRGKHMLTRTDPGVTLHTHFKMDGFWRAYEPGRHWAGPGHGIRVVLSNAEWTAVGYRLPVVELIPTAEEDSGAGYDRHPRRRAAPLGVRPGRAALPPLRHQDPGGNAGPARFGAHHLLVPALPASCRGGLVSAVWTDTKREESR